MSKSKKAPKISKTSRADASEAKRQDVDLSQIETTDGTTSIEYLLGDVARLYRTVFNQRAQPRLGLTQSQTRTIVHLSRNEGINQAGLADILEVQPITLARTLDRLCADGWVERRANPKDRRAFTLHLKDKAMPVLDEVRDLALDLREDIFGSLTDKERTQFAEKLERVWETLVTLDRRSSRNITNNQKTATEDPSSEESAA